MVEFSREKEMVFVFRLKRRMVVRIAEEGCKRCGNGCMLLIRMLQGREGSMSRGFLQLLQTKGGFPMAGEAVSCPGKGQRKARGIWLFSRRQAGSGHRKLSGHIWK